MTAGVAAAPGAAPQSVGGELAGRLEGVRVTGRGARGARGLDGHVSTAL